MQSTNPASLVTNAFVACLAALPLASQRLVRDIAPNVPVQPRGAGTECALAGGRVVFAATDPVHGFEPWVTDGTTAGSRALADIEPGVGSSHPHAFLPLGAQVLFVATTRALGSALWRTDGTLAGTAQVCVLGRTEQGLLGVGTTWNGKAWFSAGLGRGVGFFVSDGTARGTHLLAEFAHFGRGISGVAAPVPWNGRLWFSAARDGDDDELWCSDGTIAGTRLVADLEPGPQASFPCEFTPLGADLVFLARDQVHGDELRVTDGTSAGTRLVLDASPGPSSGIARILGVQAGRVTALGVEPGSLQATLWRTGGSAATTRSVGPIGPTGSRADSRARVATVGRKLLFGCKSVAGDTLLVSDGTGDGTRVLAGPTSSGGPMELRGLLADGPMAWVTLARRGASPRAELWHSDGTDAGTTLVFASTSESFLDSRALLTVGGRRCFLDVLSYPEWSGLPAEADLWFTDGTQAGTTIVARPPLADGGYAAISTPVPAGERAVFLADDGVHGRELWSSDGTAAGTQLVVDLVPGSQSPSIPDGLLSVGERVLFPAPGVSGLPGLWVSDGTAAGTRMAFPGIWWIPEPRRALRHRGETFFVAFANGGWAIYAADPTASALRFVAPASEFSELTRVGDDLYWSWSSNGGGLTTQTIFTSDGLAPAKLVFSVAGPVGSLGSLVGHQGKLLFVRRDAAHESLLSYDPASMSIDTVIASEPVNALREIVSSAGKIFLTRVEGKGKVVGPLDGANQLCVSDGTKLAPRIVHRCEGSSVSRDKIHGLRSVTGGVLFVCNDVGHGNLLWRSDGTLAGTIPLVAPGTCLQTSVPVRVGSGDLHVFMAEDLAHGCEPWITDGTVAGTRLLNDVEPGQRSSFAEALARCGGRFYFAASSGGLGHELHELTVPETNAAFADTYGTGCAATSNRTPWLEARGAPTLSNLGFAIAAGDAPPNAATAWLVGTGRASVALGTCTALVAPPWYVIAQRTSSTGTATLPLPIPGDPAFLGLELRVQAAFADGAGLALSDGMRVLVGAR